MHVSDSRQRRMLAAVVVSFAAYLAGPVLAVHAQDRLKDETFLGKSPAEWEEALDVVDPDRTAFKQLVKGGRDSLPLLCAMFRREATTESTRDTIGRIFSRMADDVVPRLIDEFDATKDLHLRRCLGKALGARAASSAAALARVLRIVEDTEDELRDEVASRLPWAAQGTDAASRPIVVRAAEYVPRLIRLLRDKSSRVRAGAAETLGLLGRAALPALPELERLFEEERNADTGHEALVASEVIWNHTTTLDLVVIARSGAPKAKIEAMRRIRERAPDTSSAIPCLIERLDEADGDVRLAAVLAIEVFGYDAKAAEPKLRKIEADGSGSTDRLKTAAKEAIVRVTTKPLDETGKSPTK